MTSPAASLFAIDYRIVPREGEIEAVLVLLRRLADALRGRPGLADVVIFVDDAHGACYFAEQWTDRAARDAAGEVFPRDLLKAIVALSDAPPRATELRCYRPGA